MVYETTPALQVAPLDPVQRHRSAHPRDPSTATASMAVAKYIAVVVRWQERCAPPMARFTCLTILYKDGV